MQPGLPSNRQISSSCPLTRADGEVAGESGGQQLPPRPTLPWSIPPRPARPQHQAPSFLAQPPYQATASPGRLCAEAAGLAPSITPPQLAPSPHPSPAALEMFFCRVNSWPGSEWDPLCFLARLAAPHMIGLGRAWGCSRLPSSKAFPLDFCRPHSLCLPTLTNHIPGQTPPTSCGE